MSENTLDPGAAACRKEKNKNKQRKKKHLGPRGCCTQQEIQKKRGKKEKKNTLEPGAAARTRKFSSEYPSPLSAKSLFLSYSTELGSVLSNLASVRKMRTFDPTLGAWSRACDLRGT